MEGEDGKIRSLFTVCNTSKSSAEVNGVKFLMMVCILFIVKTCGCSSRRETKFRVIKQGGEILLYPQIKENLNGNSNHHLAFSIIDQKKDMRIDVEEMVMVALLVPEIR